MKQDKDIETLMLVIEVHGQDLFDKMKLDKNVSGPDVRHALMMLGDHTMELAKTLSDLHVRIETLAKISDVHARGLNILVRDLENRQPTDNRSPYQKLRAIFRQLFRPPSV